MVRKGSAVAEQGFLFLFVHGACQGFVRSGHPFLPATKFIMRILAGSSGVNRSQRLYLCLSSGNLQSKKSGLILGPEDCSTQ